MNKRMIGLLAAVAGLVVSLGLCAWLMSPYGGQLTPARLFMDADIIVKMVMLLITLLILPIFGLGLAAVISGKGQLNLPLAIFAAMTVVLGLLGALYGVMNVQQGIAAVGPVSFDVTAASYAEAAMAAVFGFFGATLALGLARLGDRRPRTAG